MSAMPDPDAFPDRLPMSISLKLLIAGALVAMTALTATAVSHLQQMQARQDVRHLFDRAVDPLATVQYAQGRVELLEQRFLEELKAPAAASLALPSQEAVLLVDALSEVLDRLGEAGALLPSESPAVAALEPLRYAASRLRASQGEVSHRLVVRELGALNDGFEGLVRALRADVSALRAAAGAGILQAMRVQVAGTALLLVLGAGLLAWIGLSVRQAVRRASLVAASLPGEGAARSDPGAPAGRFSELWRILEDTRRQVAKDREAAARETAARQQTFEEEIRRQRERFDAAIENIGHGFCLLDEKRNLVVANAPFSAMFSHLKPGATARELKEDPHLGPLFAATDQSVIVRETANGEAIEIRRRGGARGTVITVENVTERRAASRRIEELSGCDALTGLPNRARFLERLESLLKHDAQRGDIRVHFVEVEGFKAVNASLGHAAGDSLMRVAAERLAECLEEGDFLARVGADEFAILQVDAARAAPEALAARIIAAFEEPVAAGARLIDARIVVGIVPVRARGTRTPRKAQEVMQEGEVVLAHLRQAGKGGHCVFTPAMREAVDERRQLEADLKTAFGAGQLELFYQPFVDAERGRVSGFEALMRWRHPVRGMVSPALFIPIAEELDLIDEMGRWALRTACRHAAGWPEDLTISVNLSPSQFRSDTLCDEVAAILRETGLAPSRLQIEVTESLFLDQAERTLGVLTTLRGLGLTISMDDFGTGYSSLGYLSRFPFDKIKIDQSFVRDMDRPENVAIVRAVIGLSTSMKMSVIAEGVETVEQYERLRAEGCFEMQGFLFSRPRPAVELPRMISDIRGRFEQRLGVSGTTKAVA